VTKGRRHRSYLVECYWPGVDEEKIDATLARARSAAAELRGQGRDPQLVGSILVPAEETVFWLFDGEEADVRAAATEAVVSFERVLESIRIDASGGSDD
jgi:hypothetical protein